ncbi:G-protein coupled receptor [Biomphalaria glabrata]|nr:putative G-protein coupled receptor [Biomphalaria glabrata]KAI8750465.1 G-protein coupled receptor [Biomphalaria glabrata]
MFYQFTEVNQSSKSWKDVSFFAFSDENYGSTYTMLQYLTYRVMVPIVSILGVLGNAASILILYKQGLKKSSNILIFALAVADSMFLVGINNASLKVYLDINFPVYGYYYAEDVAMLLYVTFHLFVLLETVGKVASMILPPLIIVERFIAVFFPLHFSSVITSARIKAAVAIMFLLGLPAYFFYIPMTKYLYTLDVVRNATAGYILKSDSFAQDAATFGLISEIYATLCGPTCVCFVIVGCVLIAVRIQLQVKKRASLSQAHLSTTTSKANLDPVNGKMKEAKSKRTTKILLSVCVVYSITGSFNFVSDMVLNSQRLGIVLGNIFHWMSIIVLCINSAANFLIYVALNRNFREMYKRLFCTCL